MEGEPASRRCSTTPGHRRSDALCHARRRVDGHRANREERDQGRLAESGRRRRTDCCPRRTARRQADFAVLDCRHRRIPGELLGTVLYSVRSSIRRGRQFRKAASVPSSTDYQNEKLVSFQPLWRIIRNAPQGGSLSTRPSLTRPGTDVRRRSDRRDGQAAPAPADDRARTLRVRQTKSPDPQHQRSEGHEHPEAHPGRQGPERRRRHRHAQAGSDLPDPQGADRAERLHVLRGRARGAAGRLRLPARARLQLPARARTTSTSRRRRFASSTCRPATRCPARCGRRRTASATSR